LRLDVGAIAKGYAVDLAIEAMRKNGAIGGMVEAGGDLRCFGTPPHKKKHWIVGVQDPNVEGNEVLGGKLKFNLKINDAAVVSSGNYFRYSAVQGRHISHIVEPSSGQGADKFSCVTVIASNTADADALATAVSVLGLEEGKKLIESWQSAAAIFITLPPDYNVIFTKIAVDYLLN